MLEVYRREGMRALWRGHMANILRVAPYSGIQFMVYDCIKSYFERYSRHATLCVGTDVDAQPIYWP